MKKSIFGKAKHAALEMRMTLNQFTSLALKALMMKQGHSKKTALIKLPTYGVKGEKILSDADTKRFRDEDYLIS
ncbi:MAG: hypothetical protein WCO92_04140 [Verrucomicrobiota bacterium]